MHKSILATIYGIRYQKNSGYIVLVYTIVEMLLKSARFFCVIRKKIIQFPAKNIANLLRMC